LLFADKGDTIITCTNVDMSNLTVSPFFRMYDKPFFMEHKKFWTVSKLRLQKLADE